MHTKWTSTWLKRIGLSAVLSILPGFAAWAQTPQKATPSLEMALAPGTTVWITDAVGHEAKTRIVSVSGDVVTTASGEDVRRLRPTDVTRVRVRHSDPVLNGAVIGAGAAVASGLLLCSLTETWENCRDDVGPMLAFGAIGAGAGIGIDALIRGRKTIYEAAPGSTRLRASPILAPHARGLQVSIGF